MKNILNKKFLASITLLLAAFSALAEPVDPVKPFEGNWESCYVMHSKSAILPGEKICTGYHFLQNDKKICGTWADFAAAMSYGQLQGIAQDATHARITKICGEPGGDIITACADEEAPAALQTWQSVSTELELCEGQLMQKGQLCRPGTRLGLKKQTLTKAQQKELVDLPWVKDCLAH